VSPTGLVLNELKGQGSGPDYIELFNRTQEPLDIAGCYVSDDSNNRVTFPTGASIAATSYVLVRLQQSTSTGLVTSCLGYTPCYDGIAWGISASGEVVSLRDAKGTLLDQLAYPDQNGANGLPDGQALGRVPDGGTVDCDLGFARRREQRGSLSKGRPYPATVPANAVFECR
jgi:hypothetical protein